MRSKQSGFTLIEIAIVLVIIGLLLGGVLKGQELINSAKIKNVANDLNGVSADVYAYQDRYKALPGDDPNTEARWNCAPCKGNGDGVVGASTDFFNDMTTTKENYLFWRHLRYAGFIGGDATSGEMPANAAGGFTGVQTGAGLGPDMGGLVACTTNLTGKIAEAIDRQFDDGNPQTGTIHAYSQGQTPVARTVGATNVITRTQNAVLGTVGYNNIDETQLYTICKAL